MRIVIDFIRVYGRFVYVGGEKKADHKLRKLSGGGGHVMCNFSTQTSRR